ncbi:hypothetical protein HJB63_26240, partial [Rhizobium lentis]|nr:hypothetical protein [Rhizobium lentis]MBX5062357.1 hypothetical protein [Rhizobium lentis]MBX5090785.1 hypothetical protein [Rhizobium lentis]
MSTLAPTFLRTGPVTTPRFREFSVAFGRIDFIDRSADIFYLESFKKLGLLPQLMLKQRVSIDARTSGRQERPRELEHMMDFEAFFKNELDGLHAEGRYRVFADLERHRGNFPRATRH